MNGKRYSKKKWGYCQGETHPLGTPTAGEGMSDAGRGSQKRNKPGVSVFPQVI